MEDIAEVVAGCWLLVNLAGITAVTAGLAWRWVRSASSRRDEQAAGEAAYDGA